jgi:hypothetical protein
MFNLKLFLCIRFEVFIAMKTHFEVLKITLYNLVDVDQSVFGGAYRPVSIYPEDGGSMFSKTLVLARQTT